MTQRKNSGPAGVAVTPRQSNYESYTLPTSLVELGSPPLYLAVAHWGWRLGRPFCREEVAVAFGISLHRAGDVMSYIRRTYAEQIPTRQHYERPTKGVRLRYLHILSVPTATSLVLNVPQARQPESRPAPQSKVDVRALRRWFLSRPN